MGHTDDYTRNIPYQYCSRWRCAIALRPMEATYYSYNWMKSNKAAGYSKTVRKSYSDGFSVDIVLHRFPVNIYR